MTPLHRVTIGSRVFGIAAILGLGTIVGDLQAILTLLIVAVLATTAVYVSLTTPLATAVVVTAEAAVTGLVIGLALPTGVVFLPYLVVLTLVAGISRGVVAVSAVVVAQFFSVTLVTSTWATGVSGQEILRLLSPWLLTSVGMGLLGIWLRSLGVIPQRPVADPSYESAHRLLTQLRTVARRLSSGLDPVTIGSQILEAVTDALGAGGAGVLVRTDGGVLCPLTFNDDAAASDLSPSHPAVHDCSSQMEPVVTSEGDDAGTYVAALPLRVGPRMVGVALARLPRCPDDHALEVLMGRLDELSLRLDTALTFDEIRSVATAEERRRLAREIHDGVAQEITSLGYAVDDLMALTESGGEQRAGLLHLRNELTRIIGELRLSIFDLRSEVVRETGLGSALSEYVRQVGSRSTMTVHLSLDEAPTRLRAETEAELLRIAQEAITNARKHSGARNLWVACVVNPPFARLTVRDDGSGLSRGRPDSFGLRIMRERAHRIDAQLTVTAAVGPSGAKSGTVVTVTLGRSPENSPQPEGKKNVDVRPRHEDRLTRR